MLLTFTNLYPWPDEPQRGLYNAQQFRAAADLMAERRGSGFTALRNFCPVPEWRLWRWPLIRRWRDPSARPLDTTYLPVFYVPVAGRNLSWRTYASALRRVGDVVRQSRAVLATWLYPDGVAAVHVGRESVRPVWLKVHGSDRFHLDAGRRGARAAWACRHATGVVCVSEPLAERVRRARVPAERVHVVPNGVDTTLFRWRPRAEAAAELAARTPQRRPLLERQLVLFVGHLLRIKGPDLMLEAWRRMVAEGRSDEAHLVFIGDGPLRRNLEQDARSAGLAGRVTFLGTRPHDEVALWMNLADELCQASRSEGMPNVLLEALASGLPVVATDVGACADMLRGEPAARVVAVEAPGELAAAVREQLASPADRPAMAARHAGRLSWHASAEALLQLMG